MSSDTTLDAAVAVIVKRTNDRFERKLQRIAAETDRIFARLFFAQWLFAIGVALVFSPYTWQGKVRVVHMHVWIALLLGGALISLPVAMGVMKSGAVATRYVIAFSQMLFSALLIHLTGGRIETHFHVFGSLALLAFYLDWGVMVVAALTIALDHFARGILWPESVYGITNPEWWRFLEHGFWVVFTAASLIVFCRRMTRLWRAAAEEAGSFEAMAEGEWRHQSILERDRKETEGA
jgi:hypothetical protein